MHAENLKWQLLKYFFQQAIQTNFVIFYAYVIDQFKIMFFLNECWSFEFNDWPSFYCATFFSYSFPHKLPTFEQQKTQFKGIHDWNSDFISANQWGLSLNQISLIEFKAWNPQGHRQGFSYTHSKVLRFTIKKLVYERLRKRSKKQLWLSKKLKSWPSSWHCGTLLIELVLFAIFRSKIGIENLINNKVFHFEHASWSKNTSTLQS